MTTTLPKYRIGEQVIFCPKEPGVKYALGIIDGAKYINSNQESWFYSLLMDKAEIEIAEEKIIGRITAYKEIINIEEQQKLEMELKEKLNK